VPWRAAQLLRLVVCLAALAGSGCRYPTPAVSMRLSIAPETPADASVTIDEEFVGVLGYVAARGVRLREGEHRITIERDGYFPWDQIVVSDRKPIQLNVKMIRIPD